MRDECGSSDATVGVQWRIRIPFPGGAAEIKSCPEKHSIHSTQINKPFIGGSLIVTLLASRRLAPTSFTRKPAIQTVGGGRSSIRSTTGINISPSIYTRRSDGFCYGRNLLVAVIETSPITRQTDGGGAAVGGGRA
ncbi:glutathione-independent formaldehyde dehydrogenase [Dorcoceras hygrometricum]|uniref:Glutathione-independent formaldehyde dehydrogenase n=1 Tax=Dorcoceras hygrometricum TaxID=472368 RepID=A0A2Z7ANP6_9LAMI|nr:glutathione-independent formaldehyde dehydrogenase [Dorcoceras hygrometricum]